MRTNEYSYYTPAFREYNVAQAVAIPFLDKDVNLVIAFPTATGKTVLAECCFAYHLKTSDKKVAYVCPYRSLASQKHADWTGEFQLSKYGLAISTSDSRIDEKELLASRLSVLTCESFDAKTRSPMYESWLESLICVIFDESHLLGTGRRGSAVEAAIMRFTSFNTRSRIVLLSATMSNAKEIARWIKSLNGKETKCITSTWRPVKLDIHYHEVEDADDRTDRAVELARSAKNDKTIVFVHSKIVGKEILKRLRSMGIRCAFHNASLSAEKRSLIERTFNDRMSGLNLLISTSTLGAGVNMAV